MPVPTWTTFHCVQSTKAWWKVSLSHVRGVLLDHVDTLNYHLHCNNSDITDRLQYVVKREEVQQLREDLEDVKQVRKHELEVVGPCFQSRRIINMANYFTSVQLLLKRRLKGLDGRGPGRGGSKHYPKHTILQKEGSAWGDYSSPSPWTITCLPRRGAI